MTFMSFPWPSVHKDSSCFGLYGLCLTVEMQNTSILIFAQSLDLENSILKIVNESEPETEL